jgi:hypothetical protein
MAIGGAGNTGVFAAQLVNIRARDLPGPVSVASAAHKLEMEQTIARIKDGLT